MLILLSGGLDSLLIAHRADREGVAFRCVWVDYGQPAAEVERAAARAISAHYGVGLHELAIPLALGDMGRGIGAQVVPGRNLALLAVAANLAAGQGIGAVAYGPTFDDWADYEDCRPSWADHLSRLAPVEILAPLARMTKAQVIREAIDTGAPVDLAWSCYRPDGGRPCQRCASCRARRDAWAESRDPSPPSLLDWLRLQYEPIRGADAARWLQIPYLNAVGRLRRLAARGDAINIGSGLWVAA